jgi:hypothetical protein
MFEFQNDQQLIEEVSFRSFLNKADELSRILYTMVKNLSN